MFLVVRFMIYTALESPVHIVLDIYSLQIHNGWPGVELTCNFVWGFVSRGFRNLDYFTCLHTFSELFVSLVLDTLES